MSGTRLRLLCAYDGSDASKAAIRAAGALLGPADATVLTVRENPPLSDLAVQGRVALPSEDVARSLRELDDQLHRDAQRRADEGAALAESCGLRPATAVLRSGRPWRAIEAVGAGHDVIVCGTRGHGALGRAVLGSTASSLLSGAQRPILVTPAWQPGDGRLVVAYDGGDAADAALRFAADRYGDRRLVVTTVWRSAVRHSIDARALAHVPVEEIRAFVTDYERLFRETAEERAQAGADLARSLGADASPRAVESGAMPWHALLDVAEEERVDAIVCGTGDEGRLQSALRGSVSAGLLHHAPLPVLVVPHARVHRDDGRDAVTVAELGAPT